MTVIYNFRIFITYSSRQSLDRRRLEDGHMRYAVLKVVSWYGEKMSPQTFPILPSVNETLATMTMKYYSNFTTKYSGAHTFKLLAVHAGNPNMNFANPKYSSPL